jgi:hypothetical protein
VREKNRKEEGKSRSSSTVLYVDLEPDYKFVFHLDRPLGESNIKQSAHGKDHCEKGKVQVLVTFQQKIPVDFIRQLLYMS